MTQVRGSLLLNSFAFVRELAGIQAHHEVLARLPADARHRCEHAVLESSWQEYEDLLAYMRAAKALYGAADPLFNRRMGRFSGERNRRVGGFAALAPEPGIAMRMARQIWRSLYDSGHSEVIGLSDRLAATRIHDFPAQPAHCERLCGALEGILSTESRTAHAVEVECAASGAPYCEILVCWE